MSQIIKLNNASSLLFLETLTGNSGGAVSADASNNIDVVGDGTTVNVVGTPASHTLTISAAGSVPIEFDTDAGNAVPALGILDVFGAHGINTAGATNVVTIAINNAITLGDLTSITGSTALHCTTGDVTLSSGNINLASTNAAGTVGIITVNAIDFMHSYGTNNTFLGQAAGNQTLTVANAITNVGIGTSALAALTTGAQNVAVGYQAMTSSTSAGGNTCVGYEAGQTTTAISGTFVGALAGQNASGNQNDAFGLAACQITTGSYNSGLGCESLLRLTTGTLNVAIGNLAGYNYTSSESRNICIGAGNHGVVGDQNVLRIGGATGTGDGQINKSYISGIWNKSVSTISNVMLIDQTNLIGTVAVTQASFNTGTVPIFISADNSATSVNIATGAAAKTVLLGSTSSTSSMSIRSGTGAFNITATNGALTIKSGTGTLAIADDATAQTVNIATGAGVKVVTLGSTNGASSLALKTGTADFSLASATGTIMSALDTGEITYPLQSAFLAQLATTASNKTGNGTSYTLGTDALTEIFDQNSDFNTNGTFTAPVTGRYMLGGQGVLTGCTIAALFSVNITTSNRVMVFAQSRTGSSQDFYSQANCFMDMDAADTYTFVLNATGEAADTDDVFGTATNVFNGMWGYLSC